MSKILSKNMIFEFNEKEYELYINDVLYSWTLEEERHMFIWYKSKNEWSFVERHKSKSSDANWYSKFAKTCDCPEVEIEYQRYIREQKLNRIV